MRIELGTKLKNAICNNELETYFQPQYHAKSGELVGLEALMRWQSDGNYISPVLFISIAEERGLINELGLWILNDACLKLKDWQSRKLLPSTVTLSVNISSRQLQFDGFLDSLSRVLNETGIAPNCLELELTESAVMADPEQCIRIFKHVQQLGCRISVDDFGTGYSSLSYLSSLPLDALKIDRSFVNDIIQDGTNQAIVKAIIGLSHNLGLKVVAEGVETEAQHHFLRDNGCDVMQGYLLSRPVPANELESML
jgi:EAL domain-containing protein (putative c-di-GMP-specific phosphodiesterase class I)